jgi:Flp pilus assembly protein TadD
MESEHPVSITRNIHRKIYKTGPLIASSLIAVITLGVFIRVLNADFVYWDDNWLIFENSKLGALNLTNLWAILKNYYYTNDYYTPLAGLRWSIIYTLSGLQPFAYHLANLLFHVANAVLLFWVVRKLILLSLGKERLAIIPQFHIDIAAVLAVLMWSLNPLMVEPVAWITGGTHTQAAFFILLSLLCYIHATEVRIINIRWLTLSVIFYTASSLSQLDALTFPAILFILDIYPLKRVANIKDWWKSQEVHQLILEKIPFITVAFAIVMVDMIVLNTVHLAHYVPSLSEFGILDRTMQAFYVWAYYFFRFWCPFNLSPVYLTLFSFKPLSLPFIMSAFFIVGCTIVILQLRHRYPSIFSAWFCYLILLLPVLGFNVHPHITSDRYGLCVFMIWSVLLAGLMLTKRKSFFIYLIPVIVILIFFGILTYKQIGIWHDTDILCRYMLDKTKDQPDHPQRAAIYRNLGMYYTRNGSIQEAIGSITEAIRIDPHYVNTYITLGSIMLNTGRSDEAEKYYEKALDIMPDSMAAHINLGALLLTEGRMDEAQMHFIKAIKINPASVEAHSNLGSLFLAQGKKEEAARQFQEVLHIEPNNIRANYYLGVIAADLPPEK